MPVKLNSSSGGSVTLQEPTTASNYTLSLPAQTATILTSSSDLTTQVKSATNASGSAPVYSCRAWVNFDGGDGNTLGTINSSGNVSSVTDLGDANNNARFQVNFTTSMPDATYSVLMTCHSGAGTNYFPLIINTWDTLATGYVKGRIGVYNNSGAYKPAKCFVAIFK